MEELEEQFRQLDAMLGATVPTNPNVISEEDKNVFKALDDILESIPAAVPIQRELTPIEVFNRDIDSNLAAIRLLLEGYFPDNWDLIDNRNEAHNAAVSLILASNGSTRSTAGLLPIPFTAIVRLPEISISNGQLSHVIRDLYVKIEFKYDLKLYNHSVRRGIVTLAEYSTDYYYSHAGRARGNVWSSLCLGHTTFNNLFSDLRLHAFTLERFEMYLLQLKPYFEWESLSGVPYVSINSIRAGHNRVHATEADLRIAVSNLITSQRFIDLAPYSVVAIGQKATINFHTTDEIWKVVSSYVPDRMLFPYDPVNAIFISEQQEDDPEYIKRLNDSLTTECQFMFKAQTVRYKIISETAFSKDTQHLERRCDRSIFLQLTSRLTNILHEYNKYEIHSRENANSDNRQG